LEEILNSLATYGYIIVALYSFGGGMVALAGGAILSSMGKMDITLTIIIASLFNFIGDIVLFYLGRYHKREVKGYLSKFKGRIHARTILLMRKFGWIAIFIKKYIYGVKTLVPIILGVSRYDMRKFIFLNFFASILWGLVVGLLSFYFSTGVREWFAR